MSTSTSRLARTACLFDRDAPLFLPSSVADLPRAEFCSCCNSCIGRSLPLQRAKLFKAGVGRDEARRGRSETQVQIRKEKKEERLNQRRRKGSAGDALGGFSFATIPEGGAPAAGTGAAAVDTPAHMRVRLCVCFSGLGFCIGLVFVGWSFLARRGRAVLVEKCATHEASWESVVGGVSGLFRVSSVEIVKFTLTPRDVALRVLFFCSAWCRPCATGGGCRVVGWCRAHWRRGTQYGHLRVVAVFDRAISLVV